jgi:tRNA-2-methylthio-N6-dimethylallyladenosine synthase
VGFPGETEQDFASTLSLLEEVRFAGVFSFTYSPRPQTAARRWEHDVTPREASGRLARLMALQQDVQRDLNRALEGSTLEVLVEGLDRRRRISSGRTRCNRVVNIVGESALPPGTLVDVRIERGFPNSLLGRTEEQARKTGLERDKDEDEDSAKGCPSQPQVPPHLGAAPPF